MRYAENAKLKIKIILGFKKDFCLYFDGKHEYQVVCLTNSFRELKLGIVKCASGSSQEIFNELKTLLDEFEAWGKI